jgi:hypothetical protein
MHIRTLKFNDGFRWLIQGLGLLKRYPLVLLMSGLTYLFVLIFSSLVPLLGVVIPTVLAPVLSLGLTQIAKMGDEGKSPQLFHLFEPFKSYKSLGFRNLMLLGVLNTAATYLALTFAGLFDDGTLLKLATGALKPDDPSVQSMSLLLPMAAFLVVYTPVQLALWFAPIFVAWKGQSVMQGLFYSFTAALHNKMAFLGYGFAWLGLVIASAALMLTANLLLGRGNPVAQYLVAPIPIILFAVFFCSFWFSYKDCIDETPERS